MRAVIRTEKPVLRRSARIRPSAKPATRPVFAGGRWSRVPVYDRQNLSRVRIAGPALVVDYGATTLIPPGWDFHVDPAGNLVARHVTITREA